MSPNLMTWIFLAAGIALTILYIWRFFRRSPQTQVSPQRVRASLPPTSEPVPINQSFMVSPAILKPQPAEIPTTSPSQEFSGSDEYYRHHTFESLNAGRKENKLPTLDPADLPMADNSDYVFGGMTPLFSSLLPESESRQQEIRKELQHAGYYQPHALQNLNAIRYVSIMIPMIGLGILFVLAPRQLELPFLLGMVALMIVGWAVPRLWVRGQARDRRSQIEKGLPDVLDLLNMCVSQGMTPLSALKRVTQELKDVYPEITEELRIVSEQAEIGTLHQALENMRNRLDIPDVHSFTNLLLQTERMGTSVSIALSEYAERMRESLRQRADQKANQASFKLLFPTVLCLMPAVYMFLLGPSVIELTDFFSGRNQIVNSADEAFQNYTDRYSNGDNN